IDIGCGHFDLEDALARDIVMLTERRLKLVERRRHSAPGHQRWRAAAKMIVDRDYYIPPVARRLILNADDVVGDGDRSRTARARGGQQHEQREPSTRTSEHRIMISPCAPRAGRRLYCLHFREIS